MSIFVDYYLVSNSYSERKIARTGAHGSFWGTAILLYGLTSYAPTFHLARIRVDEWGHSGWRYARKQIGLFAGMAYGRLRDSGVRVLTYV